MSRGLRVFSWEEVRTIRRRYAEGEAQSMLSREYRVTVNTIGRIVRGETYVEAPRSAKAAQYRGRVDTGPDLQDPESMRAFEKRMWAVQEEVNAGRVEAGAEPEWKMPPTRMTQKAVDDFREMMGRDPANYVLIPDGEA